MRTGIPLYAHYEVMATCFDTKEEIVRKYPFSAVKSISYLNALAKTGGGSPRSSLAVLTNVAFEVNATSSLLSLCSKSAASGPSHDKTFFNHVIFNFPHLGVEDCNLHASLIAHIIFRAKEVLCPRDGRLYISLAKGQADRWNLRPSAARHGFKIGTLFQNPH